MPAHTPPFLVSLHPRPRYLTCLPAYPTPTMHPNRTGHPACISLVPSLQHWPPHDATLSLFQSPEPLFSRLLVFIGRWTHTRAHAGSFCRAVLVRTSFLFKIKSLNWYYLLHLTSKQSKFQYKSKIDIVQYGFVNSGIRGFAGISARRLSCQPISKGGGAQRPRD